LHRGIRSRVVSLAFGFAASEFGSSSCCTILAVHSPQVIVHRYSGGSFADEAGFISLSFHGEMSARSFCF
jgi:hypothetical protein